MIRWLAATILVVCGSLCPPLRAEDKVDRVEIQPHVASFFQNRCTACHAKGSSKGGFSIEPLLESGAILDAGRFRAYEKAFHQVAKGKMPPAPDGRPMTFLDDSAAPLLGLWGIQ